MTMLPDGQSSPQLWMTVSDVFQIRGRGTVLTGRLEGNGLLNHGATLVCDGMRWKISRIEQFRAVVKAADPGSDVAVLLGDGQAGDMLRGKTVQFVQDVTTTSPQFTVLAPKKKHWRR